MINYLQLFVTLQVCLLIMVQNFCFDYIISYDSNIANNNFTEDILTVQHKTEITQLCKQ